MKREKDEREYRTFEDKIDVALFIGMLILMEIGYNFHPMILVGLFFYLIAGLFLYWKTKEFSKKAEHCVLWMNLFICLEVTVLLQGGMVLWKGLLVLGALALFYGFFDLTGKWRNPYFWVMIVVMILYFVQMQFVSY